MRDLDGFKFLYGPYRPPPCKIGDTLTCAVRGPQLVVGISTAPSGRAGRRFHIVCGDLERALRVESLVAGCYWWGHRSAQREDPAVIQRRAMHRRTGGFRAVIA